MSMNNKENKPFVFPVEIPPKQQKLDKGAIVDVVEAECCRKTEPSDGGGFYPKDEPKKDI